MVSGGVWVPAAQEKASFYLKKCARGTEGCSCIEIYVSRRKTNAHNSKTNKKWEERLGFGENPGKKAVPGFEYIGKRFGKERKLSYFFQKKIKKVLTNEKKTLLLGHIFPKDTGGKNYETDQDHRSRSRSGSVHWPVLRLRSFRLHRKEHRVRHRPVRPSDRRCCCLRHGCCQLRSDGC